MSLRYREATSDLLGDTQVATHGYAVLNIDSNRVARIVRLKDALEPLNDNELIINYKIVNDRLFLGAESFFFEEGQDTLYQKATYGGLKVNAKGESLLVGLYDKDFLLIKPDRWISKSPDFHKPGLFVFLKHLLIYREKGTSKLLLA